MHMSGYATTSMLPELHSRVLDSMPLHAHSLMCNSVWDGAPLHLRLPLDLGQAPADQDLQKMA